MPDNIKDFYANDKTAQQSFASESEFRTFISNPENAQQFYDAALKDKGYFSNADEFKTFVGGEKKNGTSQQTTTAPLQDGGQPVSNNTPTTSTSDAEKPQQVPLVGQSFTQQNLQNNQQTVTPQESVTPENNGVDIPLGIGDALNKQTVTPTANTGYKWSSLSEPQDINNLKFDYIVKPSNHVEISKEQDQKNVDAEYNAMPPVVKEMSLAGLKAYNGSMDILNDVTQFATGTAFGLGSKDLKKGTKDFFDSLKQTEPSSLEYKGGMPTKDNVIGAMGSMIPFIGAFATGSGELSAGLKVAGMGEAAAGNLGIIGTNIVLGYNGAYDAANDAGVKSEIGKNEFALASTALGGMLFTAMPALRQVKGLDENIAKYGAEEFANSLMNGTPTKQAVKNGLKAITTAVIDNVENAGIMTGMELTNKLSQYVSNLSEGKTNFQDTTIDPKQLKDTFILNALTLLPLSGIKGVQKFGELNSLQKQSLFEAAKDPNYYQGILNEAHDNGDLTEQQYHIATQNITDGVLLFGQIPNTLPDAKRITVAPYIQANNILRDENTGLTIQKTQTAPELHSTIDETINDNNEHIKVNGEIAGDIVNEKHNLDEVVGSDVNYNGTVGKLSKEDNGFFVTDDKGDKHLVEGGQSGKSNEELGVTVLSDITPEQINNARKDKSQNGDTEYKGKKFFVSTANPESKDGVGDKVFVYNHNGGLKEIYADDKNKFHTDKRLAIINKYLTDNNLPKRDKLVTADGTIEKLITKSKKDVSAQPSEPITNNKTQTDATKEGEISSNNQQEHIGTTPQQLSAETSNRDSNAPSGEIKTENQPPQEQQQNAVTETGATAPKENVAPISEKTFEDLSGIEKTRAKNKFYKSLPESSRETVKFIHENWSDIKSKLQKEKLLKIDCP